MLRSVSVRDILDDNLTIHAHEAVTLVQQVCRDLAWKSSLGEPVGVPPLNEIRIDAAGEAVITELKPADAPPAVPELALLLASLLPPPGRVQRRLVPAALRFTLARALGDVDARPFASVAEFCAALARFERDTPRQTVGALFDRWRTSRREDVAARVFVEGDWVVDEEGFRERQPGDVPLAGRIVAPVGVERRKRAPGPDTFRLLLRDADRRRYERGDDSAWLDVAEVPRRYGSPLPGRVTRLPAVSPDGQRIAFQVGRDGVWLVDLRDGSMRRVVADPAAEAFTWAPDSRRLAFHSAREGWRLWTVPRT